MDRNRKKRFDIRVVESRNTGAEISFPRPRWIINRHHVDDARANIEFPGAPSIDRYLAIVPGIEIYEARTRRYHL